MLHTNDKIVKHKVGLLNLTDELGNISKACKMMGVSRDTFYRYKEAANEGGVEALLDRNRRVPNHKNRVDPSMCYFWRDSNGNEVDLLIETATGLMPVEIKSGQTLNRDFFTGLERWAALAGPLACHPTLIHGGKGVLERKGVRVLGWDRVDAAV